MTRVIEKFYPFNNSEKSQLLSLKFTLKKVEQCLLNRHKCSRCTKINLKMSARTRNFDVRISLACLRFRKGFNSCFVHPTEQCWVEKRAWDSRDGNLYDLTVHRSRGFQRTFLRLTKKPWNVICNSRESIFFLFRFVRIVSDKR